MQISQKDWNAYVKRLSAINNKAADEMRRYIDANGIDDVTKLIDYAYALSTKYGEASAALSAEMYDVIATLEKGILPAAELADTASYGEVAKTIQGIMKTSVNTNQLGDAVGRLVKQAGADTTLKNAIRDRAEYAWIPVGDTCAFCLMIASQGWQPATRRAVDGDHAEHIHANCDCTYAIRFSRDDGVRGYDPGEYRAMYYAGADVPFENEDDSHPESKSLANRRLNGMRRAIYAQNKDKINAQKREAYALRQQAIEDGEIST